MRIIRESLHLAALSGGWVSLILITWNAVAAPSEYRF